MRTSRTIDFSKSDEPKKKKSMRHPGGKLSIPMFSGFFSALTDNVMCTETMYGSLQTEIEGTLSVYSEKEPVLLTVYESSSSSEETKESVLIGFKKHIVQCLNRAKNTFKLHLITFAALCAIGVVLEFLLYGAFPGALPLWVQNVLDIVAWVFVWQFAAYMAFEFIKEIRTIRRLDQILHIEYIFRHWE